MKTRDVSIHGMLAVQNFGDTLLAAACADWLIQAFPGCSVGFPWANREVLLELEECLGTGLRHYPSSRDVLIFCGGGYLNDQGGIKEQIKRLHSLYAKCGSSLRRAREIAVVGVGAGPVDGFLSKAVHGAMLRKASLLTVRDEESRLCVASLGIDEESMVLTADSAMAYLSELVPSPREVNSTNRTLGLHVTKRNSAVELGILDYLKETKDIYSNVVIFSDKKGAAASSELYSEIRALGMAVRAQGYVNYKQVINLIDNCDDVLTTKYHVGIVACSLSKRVCAIPWNYQKAVRFYRQIGEPNACLDFSSINSDDVSKHMKDRLGSGEPLGIPYSVLSSSLENKVALIKWISSSWK